MVSFDAGIMRADCNRRVSVSGLFRSNCNRETERQPVPAIPHVVVSGGVQTPWVVVDGVFVVRYNVSRFTHGDSQMSRERTLIIRVYPEELQAFQRVARPAGLVVSAWARSRLIQVAREEAARFEADKIAGVQDANEVLTESAAA